MDRFACFIGRRWLWIVVLLWVSVGAWAASYTVSTVPNVRLVDRRAFVSNPDGLLSAADVERINQQLGVLSDSLGVEVAVVAIEGIADAEPRAFANELFEAWGIGKRGVDNGLLILLVTEVSQRAVVFETGYGLEGVLPDAVCKRIQVRDMMPALRAGDYGAGMVAGVAAVCDQLYQAGVPQGAGASTGGWPVGAVVLGCLLLFIVAVVVIAYVCIKSDQPCCPHCGKRGFRFAGEKVVRQATTTDAGLRVKRWRCTHCDYVHQVEDVIPKRSPAGRVVVCPPPRKPLLRVVHEPIVADDELDEDWPIGGSVGQCTSSDHPVGGAWGGGRSGGGGAYTRF